MKKVWSWFLLGVLCAITYGLYPSVVGPILTFVIGAPLGLAVLFLVAAFVATPNGGTLLQTLYVWAVTDGK